MASKVKLVVKNESLDDGNSVGDASPRVNHKTVSEDNRALLRVDAELVVESVVPNPLHAVKAGTLPRLTGHSRFRRLLIDCASEPT